MPGASAASSKSDGNSGGRSFKIPIYRGPDHDNFHDWNFQVEGYLTGKGILGVYQERVKNPKYKIPQEVKTPKGKLKREEVESRFADFYADLTAALRDAATSTARGVKDGNPVEVMNFLKTEAVSKSQGARLAWMQEIVSEKPATGDDMREFVRKKIETMRDKLGDSVTPEELVSLGVLGNVAPEHAGTTIPLLANGVTDLTKITNFLVESEKNVAQFGKVLEETRVLCAQGGKANELTPEERRQRDQNRNVNNLCGTVAAFLAYQKGTGKGWSWNKGGRGKSGGKYGGKYGGKGGGKGKGAKKSFTKERTCWNCGQVGHEKRNCPEGKGKR